MSSRLVSDGYRLHNSIIKKYQHFMLQNHPALPKAQVPKPTSQLPTPQKESRPQGISPSDGFHSKSGGYLLSHQKGSTIGADGLNFSVRNGKRWNTVTITTIMTEHDCTANYTRLLQLTTSPLLLPQIREHRFQLTYKTKRTSMWQKTFPPQQLLIRHQKFRAISSARL